MHEHGQLHEVDDEINLWELLEQLKAGWHWLAGSSVVGLVGAIGFLILVPPKYEATAIIQPATIGMATASMTTTAITVEPVGQTLERMKLVTFYGDDTVKACQASSAKDLAGDVKISVIKGNSLLSISYRANSAAAAKTCMTKIVEQLAQSQATLAAPLIKELEDQLTSTRQQIDGAERFLAQNEKNLAAPNGSVLLMLKREEMIKLQKLYREQRTQLTAPFTQTIRLLEPIYVPENPVFPKKLLTVIGGLFGGLFLGVFALFVNRGLHRYKQTAV
jgi:uncharacterized protein involved in exopolysaccharide biosynthesis